MAKGNSNAPKGQKTVLSKSPKGLANPSFDENALSMLTERIEKGLEKSAASQGSDTRPTKSQKKHTSKDEKSRPVSGLVKKAPESGQSKKRDARGKVKESHADKSQVAPAQNGSKKADERAALLEEILALGGTEEDLELVEDAASDEDVDEIDAPANLDKSLKKELAKFVAGLGIEAAPNEDASASEAEAEADGGWEDDSSVASEPEPVVKAAAPPPAPAPVARKVDTNKSKDVNRLVSSPPHHGSRD